MNYNINKNIKYFNINFGPQHPAAHGVLRLILQLKNEQIIKCDPHIGLLHRGTEILITQKPYYLSLPYFDRLDYVSMLLQEHAYCLAIEKLNRKAYLPIIIQQTRVILDELTRILNHLLAISCHALDVGSMSSIFWAFEERENIMEIYENISGARMHAAYYKPIYNNKILNNNIIKKILFFLNNLPITINEITSILNNNKIWKLRLINNGVITLNHFINFSLTGILARSINIKIDLRILKKSKYSFYKFIQINSFVSKNGDSYDRFILRLNEILESINIINKSINTYSFKKNNFNFFYKINKKIFFMEDTIRNFQIATGLYKNTAGYTSTYIESAKGLFGVSIYLDKTTIPLKCKIRSPSYNNLFLLKYLATSNQLADLVTLIGTIDIVFGEIDR